MSKTWYNMTTIEKETLLNAAIETLRSIHIDDCGHDLDKLDNETAIGWHKSNNEKIDKFFSLNKKLIELQNCEPKIKSDSESIQKFVIRAAELFHESICHQFKKTDLTPTQRWLVFGRIINILFQNHYGMSFNLADERIKRAENESIRPQHSAQETTENKN